MRGDDKKLAAIAEINARTLKMIADGSAVWPRDPYYGYISADIFDCPPFAMFTNNDCPRAHDILYRRSFEPGSMALWCRYARAATSILDIGAHVGVYALAAAALRPERAVYAFEPNPFAAARLRVNKEINGFENIIEKHMGLAHKSTIGLISWSKNRRVIPSGASIARRPVEELSALEAAHVALRPLDNIDLGDLGDRCLMKIDVEGAEQYVFQGMTRCLAARPDIVLETFSQEHCDAINGMLLPMGYKAWLIRETTGDLEPQDRLYPRDREGDDFNQFLTTRSPGA